MNKIMTILTVCAMTLLTGCGGYVMLFSKNETFQGQDSMVLPSKRANIIDIIAEVGKSMGYSRPIA